MKRVVSILLAVMMVAGLVSAFAEAADVPEFELPIVTEPYTLTIWTPSGDVNVLSELNNGTSAYYEELEKRTGVHVEFIHPAVGTETENLSLLLASDNLPDLIQPPWGWQYSTGYEGAVADGLFYDITSLVEEKCPNYWKALHMNEDIWKESVTDSGMISGFWSISVGGPQKPFMGEVVRKDWLDELGLDVPVTYDDWYEMLKAFKEKKGAVAPMMLYYTGFHPQNLFCGGYGVTESFFVKDGEVKYGPLEEGYKDYITMLAKWYAEGLIDPDFATKKDFLPSAEYTTTDKTGAFFEQYIDLDTLAQRSDIEGYELIGVPTPRVNADDDLHVRQKNFEVGDSVWIMTADCKNPEIVAKWCDYAYTLAGELLSNYGFEGKTWEYNEEGKPEFTDFMFNNPDGYSLAELYHYYAKLGGAGLYHWDREFKGLPQNCSDAMATWEKDNDGSYVLFSLLSMTSDESNEYANIMADIDTYRSEKVISFILGAEPIENYDQFVETIKSMGIDRALEIKQASYDRYNAR